MPKEIFALDLGTTKFCLAALKYDSNLKHPQVMTVAVQAQGMRRGMLVDINKAKDALMHLLDIAEQNFKTDISRVVVGIAGSHLASTITSTRLSHPHPTVITQETLKKIRKQASSQCTDQNKLVIHNTPTDYNINNYNQTTNPLGMTCNDLIGRCFIVKAQKEYLSDVVRLCNLCGLEVNRLYAEPYASAAVIASNKAQELGVAITDIGGGTTDGMVFAEGHPQKIFTINVGGTTITNDLCIGLGVTKEEAERIKTSLGIKNNTQESTLVTKDIYNRTKIIEYETIQKILTPRIIELGELIKENISRSKCFLGSGLILTGGGSELPGITDCLRSILPYEVMKIRPQIPSHLYQDIDFSHEKTEQKSFETRFATVLGLLYLEYIRIENKNKYKKNNAINRYLQKLLGWVKELS